MPVLAERALWCRKVSSAHQAGELFLQISPSPFPVCRAAVPGLLLPAAPARGGHGGTGREGKGRPGRLGGPAGACVALPGRGASARFGSARFGSALPVVPRPVQSRRALLGPAAPLPPMLCQSQSCPHPTRRYGGPGGAGLGWGLAGRCARAGARRSASGDTRDTRDCPRGFGGSRALQEPGRIGRAQVCVLPLNVVKIGGSSCCALVRRVRWIQLDSAAGAW